VGFRGDQVKRITVTLSDSGNRQWCEEFLVDTSDPEAWARQTLASFNATLRPHEQPRSLLAVSSVDEDNGSPHRWVKLNLHVHSNHLGVYDAYRCERCGITAKRSMAGTGRLRRDSKYRAKRYDSCEYDTLAVDDVPE
jgi:hypothetical protein